jgi:hypothetical protein
MEMGCRIRIVGGRDNEAQGEALARQIGEGARNCAAKPICRGCARC